MVDGDRRGNEFEKQRYPESYRRSWLMQDPDERYQTMRRPSRSPTEQEESEREYEPTSPREEEEEEQKKAQEEENFPY